jgi:hypothetical protein
VRVSLHQAERRASRGERRPRAASLRPGRKRRAVRGQCPAPTAGRAAESAKCVRMRAAFATRGGPWLSLLSTSSLPGEHRAEVA